MLNNEQFEATDAFMNTPISEIDQLLSDQVINAAYLLSESCSEDCT